MYVAIILDSAEIVVAKIPIIGGPAFRPQKLRRISRSTQRIVPRTVRIYTALSAFKWAFSGTLTYFRGMTLIVFSNQTAAIPLYGLNLLPPFCMSLFK